MPWRQYANLEDCGNQFLLRDKGLGETQFQRVRSRLQEIEYTARDAKADGKVYLPQLNYAYRELADSLEFQSDLAVRQDELWADYLAKLEAAGIDRDTPMTPKASGGHRH